MKDIHVSDLRKILLSHFFQKATTPHELIHRFSAIQIDPVSIVCSNQLLVFGVRCENYTPQSIQESLNDGGVIEIYAKERSLILKENASLFGPLMRARREKNKELLNEHSEAIASCLDFIKERRSVSARDFKFEKIENTGTWGAKTKATMILNLLWEIGDVISLRREGRNTYYGIAPPDIWRSSQYTNPEEILVRRWKAYLDGVGVTDTRDTFAGFGKNSAKERRRILEKLVEIGWAVPVRGIGSESWLCVASTKIIEETKFGQTTSFPCFVSPLDNFIWNRPLIKEMWHFEYTWEIYTPPEKRKFGPYAMPLVTPEGVFGPVDFRFDTATNQLVGKISESPLHASAPRAKEAAEAASLNLKKFLGADTLSLR